MYISRRAAQGLESFRPTHWNFAELGNPQRPTTPPEASPLSYPFPPLLPSPLLFLPSPPPVPAGPARPVRGWPVSPPTPAAAAAPMPATDTLVPPRCLSN